MTPPRYWGPDELDDREIRTNSITWVVPIVLFALGIAIKVTSAGWSLGDIVKFAAMGAGRVLDLVFGN